MIALAQIDLKRHEELESIDKGIERYAELFLGLDKQTSKEKEQAYLSDMVELKKNLMREIDQTIMNAFSLGRQSQIQFQGK
jgi:hypothetical protein